MKLEKLKAWLELGKWQDADRKTTEIILEAVNRTKEGWLRVEDIDRLTGDDLGAIDRLWRKYSNNQFGFSIQRKIYRQLGGTRVFNFEVWDDFCDRVGWLDIATLQVDDDIEFQKKVPIGHLPGHQLWCGFILADEAIALLTRQDF